MTTAEQAQAALEAFDRCASVRTGLRHLSTAVNEWAGLPMPLDGEQLTIEPSYPWASALGRPTVPEEPDDGWRVRNVFWSKRYRCNVAVMESPEGRIEKTLMPAFGLDHALRTLGCSAAWGIEQEHRALVTLGEHLRHHAFKHYVLTGTFLESSRRSGVTYLFRRLRPTVAIREDEGRCRVLAALCLHPIGYYAESWAGAMCPTDDVLAHLMLMRGDEVMFWRRSNQIAPWFPEAGL